VISKTCDTGSPCLALTLLALLIFLVYANSLNADWQMDDKPNILDNQDLQIDNLLPDNLFQSFFAHPGTGKRLYRPLVCLTFAINWYFGKDDSAGYHWVNIIIHILAAFVLYSVILILFETPTLKGKYSEKEIHFISLLSATLWAVNPIQTQAVTYIVQRMTAMSALFYMLGLFSYIRARLSFSPSRKTACFTGCILSFLCALGSKENAAIFPLSLIVIEIAFFRFSLKNFFRNTPQNVALGLGVLTFIALFLYYSKGDLFFFLKGYEHRSFSVLERILTQPRVILFYLSLIFYPLPQRLSVDHDIVLSTSFLSPWSTLPSILILSALTILGVALLRKNPIIGFAIPFFFVNHLIESTIIPLEMIFEHRNYLPSAFLFFPVAMLLHVGIRYYRDQSRWISIAVTAFPVFLLINLGWGTHIRNFAWASSKSLWEDALKKAPGNSRPLVNLAIELGWKENATQKDLAEALFFLKKALTLNKPNNYQQADIYGNIAGILFRMNEYENAVLFYEKALTVDPLFIQNRYDLAQSLILLKRFDEASYHLDFILNNSAAKNYKYPNLKGFVLLWQDRYPEALLFLQEALHIAPGVGSVLLNTGVALSRLQSFKNAEWFFLRAVKMSPDDIMPHLFLIENALRADDLSGAYQFSKILLSRHSITQIEAFLNSPTDDYVFPPVDKTRIAPILKDTIKDIL